MYYIEDIKKVLPHRYPFLLIDRVIDIIETEEEKKIIAIKNITSNEDFFNGHFPNKPMMPGVLILEALAQTGAFYVLKKEEYQGKVALFTGANNVKWRKQVVPGDVLVLEVSIDKIRRNIGKGSAKAFVDNHIVCEAEITFFIQ